MAATCDGAVLLVNVHVGGVPRSTDSGLTWRPPIDINSDVHQVCAHPTRPDIVIAAAGLCISRDAGATWTIESRDFTPIIALPLLLGGTTFSYQHPPTLLRRKAQFNDARSPATVRYSLCAEACRSGSTASPIPTASRPGIQWPL